MNRKQHFKTLIPIYVIVDILVTIGAWELSFFIRFFFRPDALSSLFTPFLYYSFLLTFLVVVSALRNHLYEQWRYFPWYTEFLLMIKSQLQAIATFVIIIYFTQPNRLSRITIGLYIGFGIIFAIISRGILRGIMQCARKRGFNLRHIIIIGQGRALCHYVHFLVNNPERGVRCIGWISEGDEPKELGIERKTMEDIPLEGENAPDAVIIGYDAKVHQNLDETLEFFNRTSIHVFVIPNIENAFIGYTIDEFHGSPMISINAANMNTFQAFFKRLMDIIGSFVGLALLSPLFIILATLVKLNSKGPVFFGQKRITKNGDTFTMWKFRSMHIDAEKSGAKWTAKNDDRCTSIGQFLRRTSLDEIPQFWNVLRGDMSLVGPRPEQPSFVEQFRHEIPSYMLRHKMKSGITGWAQVNGWRGDTSLVDRIECDLYYIRNWSLGMDIKIILLTIIKGFIHENAY